MAGLPRVAAAQLVALCILAAMIEPALAQAPPAGRVYRLGMLAIAPTFGKTAAGIAFDEGLRGLGYVEGRNLFVERRYSEGRPERWRPLAEELVGLKVDAILVFTTPAAVAARGATTTIPIVFVTAIDPVGAGLAASLARPGGNVTGLSTLSPELSAKRLAIVRELSPGVTRVGVFSNAANTASPFMLRQTEEAARQLGITLKVYGVRGPEDFDETFAAVDRERPGALLVFADAMLARYRERIAHFTVQARLPAIFENREFAEAGGLLSYGANYPEMFRRAAVYVDRVLKGHKPSELPFEQPAKFDFVINLDTARRLGLAIPASLRLQATEVIQ